MADNFKVKTAKSLFTKAVNKACKKYKSDHCALIITVDEEFNPNFLLFANSGYVLDEDGEVQVFKIDDLLNIFDSAMLSAFKSQFDLIEEISALIERYCKQFEISSENVSVMFQIKSDENAYPALYNAGIKVKEISYDEIFESYDSDDDDNNDE